MQTLGDSSRTISGEKLGRGKSRGKNRPKPKRKLSEHFCGRANFWASMMKFGCQIGYKQFLLGGRPVYGVSLRFEFVVLVFLASDFLVPSYWVFGFYTYIYILLASKWNGNMFCRPSAHGKQTTSPNGKLGRLKFPFSQLAKILWKVFKTGSQENAKSRRRKLVR